MTAMLAVLLLALAGFLVMIDREGQSGVEYSEQIIATKKKRQIRNNQDPNRIWNHGGKSNTDISHREKSSSVANNQPPLRRYRFVPSNQSVFDRNIGLSDKEKGDTRSGSRNIVIITSLDSNGETVEEKIRHLREMRDNLSSGETEALASFLELGQLPQGMPVGRYRWLVDEMMTTLRNSGDVYVDVTELLTSVYKNKNQDVVVRDYALQHLGHYREKSHDSTVIEKTLLNATRAKEGSLAGTALLALARTSDEKSYAPTLELEKRALSIASNVEMSLSSRVTALQIAAKNGLAGVDKLVVEIAQNEHQPDMLRIAALGIIRQKGNNKLLDEIALRTKNQRILQQIQK